jgi:pyruvate/2-oxoacid:ferredoxin oxidoreductase alpha subunit
LEAEVVLVSVGDASAVVRDTVNALGGAAKVGAVIVHLLRPWDSERFVASIPESGTESRKEKQNITKTNKKQTEHLAP